MSKKTCKDCLHCTVDSDEVLCVDMPWHYPFGGSDSTTPDKEACDYFDERDKPTIFDRITESPETLAEKLVYIDGSQRVFNTIWRSTLLPNKYWKTEAEALAATVAKLKEGVQ